MMHVRLFRSALFTTIVCAVATAPTMAQQPPSIARATELVDSIPKTKNIQQVAISPDGKQIASIVDGQLSVSSANGGDSHDVSLGKKIQARELAWSSNSKQLAVIADMEGEVPQAEIWLYDGSAVKRIAALKGVVQSPSFSPDGAKLAVL